MKVPASTKLDACNSPPTKKGLSRSASFLCFVTHRQFLVSGCKNERPPDPQPDGRGICDAYKLPSQSHGTISTSPFLSLDIELSKCARQERRKLVDHLGPAFTCLCEGQQHCTILIPNDISRNPSAGEEGGERTLSISTRNTHELSRQIENT